MHEDLRRVLGEELEPAVLDLLEGSGLGSINVKYLLIEGDLLGLSPNNLSFDVLEVLLEVGSGLD